MVKFQALYIQQGLFGDIPDVDIITRLRQVLPSLFSLFIMSAFQ